MQGYVEPDFYGRGHHALFGKGAKAKTALLARLSLLRLRQKKSKNNQPAEQVDYDLYGRGDPRIFGENAHVLNRKQAYEYLQMTQRTRSHTLQDYMFPSAAPALVLISRTIHEESVQSASAESIPDTTNIYEDKQALASNVSKEGGKFNEKSSSARTMSFTAAMINSDDALILDTKPSGTQDVNIPKKIASQSEFDESGISEDHGAAANNATPARVNALRQMFDKYHEVASSEPHIGKSIPKVSPINFIFESPEKRFAISQNSTPAKIEQIDCDTIAQEKPQENILQDNPVDAEKVALDDRQVEPSTPRFRIVPLVPQASEASTLSRTINTSESNDPGPYSTTTGISSNSNTTTSKTNSSIFSSTTEASSIISETSEDTGSGSYSSSQSKSESSDCAPVLTNANAQPALEHFQDLSSEATLQSTSYMVDEVGQAQKLTAVEKEDAVKTPAADDDERAQNISFPNVQACEKNAPDLKDLTSPITPAGISDQVHMDRETQSNRIRHMTKSHDALCDNADGKETLMHQKSDAAESNLDSSMQDAASNSGITNPFVSAKHLEFLKSLPQLEEDAESVKEVTDAEMEDDYGSSSEPPDDSSEVMDETDASEKDSGSSAEL